MGSKYGYIKCITNFQLQAYSNVYANQKLENYRPIITETRKQTFPITSKLDLTRNSETNISDY